MRFGIVLAFLGFALVPGRCATLALENHSAAAGQTLTAALSFSAEGQVVSAVQFDIASDSAISIRVLPGAQTGASNKVLYTTSLPDRVVRVSIIGMNRDVIGDGELLRSVISVDPSAAPGIAQIHIDNALASDPDGNLVPLRSVVAAVQIEAGTVAQFFAPASVVNGASLLSGPISPGEIIAILGGADLSGASTVLVNGVPAPILYSGPAQVNAIVPFSLAPSDTVRLEVRTQERSLGTVSLSRVAAAPAIFTQDSSGSGPGAILNEDLSVNSFSNPARAGSAITLYGTGFGPLNPQAIDGQSATAPASTATPVIATIAGLPAEVTYAGAAPGLIAGVVQINVRLPDSIRPTPVAPVVLTIGSATTPPGPTVSIQ